MAWHSFLDFTCLPFTSYQGLSFYLFDIIAAFPRPHWVEFIRRVRFLRRQYSPCHDTHIMAAGLFPDVIPYPEPVSWDQSAPHPSPMNNACYKQNITSWHLLRSMIDFSTNVSIEPDGDSLCSCNIMASVQFVFSLTHWGREKMAAIIQMTSSNAFSWMKMYQFRLRFYWNLFQRVQSTKFHHWFR